MTKINEIAVLWGGGLGDFLIIRPLLQRMNERWGVRPYYLSRRFHFPELFTVFGLDVTLHKLPDSAPALLRDVRSLIGRFDGVYVGGRDTLKTRMLGHVLQADRFWHATHPDSSPFVQEQVLADCVSIGLGDYAIDDLVTDTLNWSARQDGEPIASKDCVVLHPSSKAGWKTKNWPDTHWRELVRRLVDEFGQRVCLVGAEGERSRLMWLAEGVADRSLVEILTGLSVPMLFRVVAQSRGVICHNSGVLHVAVQSGTRVVCLNGASADYWRAPYAWVDNLDSGRCSLRCNRYRCPIPGFDARCIKDLRVERVLEHARRFLLGNT